MADDVIAHLPTEGGPALYDALCFLAEESAQWPLINNKPAAVEAVVNRLQMATRSDIATKALAVLDGWAGHEAMTNVTYGKGSCHVADTIIKQQGVQAVCQTISTYPEPGESQSQLL